MVKYNTMKKEMFNLCLKRFFSDYIARYRKLSDITQEEMAFRLNIDLRSYADIEHGINMCSIPTLVSFVKAFDINVGGMFEELFEYLNTMEGQL